MDVKSHPVCLTIAGSDSGGGAGIQADLRTFTYFNTFGASVITAITAQNPLTVDGIYPVPVGDVIQQYRTVSSELAVSSIKTGMLFSRGIVRAVGDELRQQKRTAPVIIDPVMIATSGSSLIRDDYVQSLTAELFPLAELITPNVHEAEVLIGNPIRNHTDLRNAAIELSRDYRTNFLLKGGHMTGDFATDYLATMEGLYELKTKYLKYETTHGSGCMLSAAIAANIASGSTLIDSVVAAKSFIYHSLINSVRIGNRTFAIGTPGSADRSIVELKQL